MYICIYDILASKSAFLFCSAPLLHPSQHCIHTYPAIVRLSKCISHLVTCSKVSHGTSCHTQAICAVQQYATITHASLFACAYACVCTHISPTFSKRLSAVPILICKQLIASRSALHKHLVIHTTHVDLQ